MARPKLNDELRKFIVRSLACFDSPATVRKALKEDHGIEVSLQAIEQYDATKSNALKKWVPLFEQIRKQFIADSSSIGISHRSRRLRALDKQLTRAEQVGNTAMVRDLVETAAKEVGDAFTNKQKVDHKHELHNFSMKF